MSALGEVAFWIAVTVTLYLIGVRIAFPYKRKD